MNVNEMYPSKWLKKEDIKAPTVVVITSVSQELMMDNGRNVPKPVLNFSGNIKPMILNKGNAMVIASIHGDDIAAWSGKTVELWVDPSVQMQGKIVGGLRIRPASAGYRPTQPNGFAAHPVQQPAPVTLYDASDGNTMLNRVTAEEVRKFIEQLYGNTGLPASQVRVRIAGQPTTMKPADQWPEFNGPQQWVSVNGQSMQAPVDDPIPF